MIKLTMNWTQIHVITGKMNAISASICNAISALRFRKSVQVYSFITCGHLDS